MCLMKRNQIEVFSMENSMWYEHYISTLTLQCCRIRRDKHFWRRRRRRRFASFHILRGAK